MEFNEVLASKSVEKGFKEYKNSVLYNNLRKAFEDQRISPNEAFDKAAELMFTYGASFMAKRLIDAQNNR